MKVKYVGKKSGLLVKAPYLSAEYPFERDVPLDTVDDDGVLLLDLFPDIFQKAEEDPVAIPPAGTVEGSETDEQSDGEYDGEPLPADTDDDEDFTFELDKEGTSFLCPLCDKTYKVNKGRGKFALVGHLESVHAEEWQAMKSTPPVEE